MKKNIVVIMVALVLSFFSIIYLSNNWLRVSENIVNVDNLPDKFREYRIVHLCDLHAVEFGENQENLLSKVRQARPDIIAFTGDLADHSGNDINKLISFMNNLQEIAPVYFVQGNHDYWYKQYSVLITRMKDTGITILDNRSLLLTKEDSQLILAGVDDPFTGHDDLDMALKGVKAEDMTILLSHTPDLFNEAAGKGVDLVLAGHYHGGQIRLPFVRALYAPGHKFFPKYDSGLYQQGKAFMYLSRGLGHTGILNFRFFNRPEISVIILK